MAILFKAFILVCAFGQAHSAAACSLPATNATSEMVTYLGCLKTSCEDANSAWMATLSGLAAATCPFVAAAVGATEGRCGTGMTTALGMLAAMTGKPIDNATAAAVATLKIVDVCCPACKVADDAKAAADKDIADLKAASKAAVAKDQNAGSASGALGSAKLQGGALLAVAMLFMVSQLNAL